MKFKFKATTSPDGLFSAKLKGAMVDADVGKPVKLSVDTSDTYELCDDGDGIDAFIVGIDPSTADGLVFATLRNQGRVRAEADGASVVGNLVEAGEPADVGTAEANGLPMVSTHTAAAGDIVRWRIISANDTAGVVATGDTTVIIERV